MASDPVPPVPLERLLDHRPWVRSLARALVRDSWAADDLEQDLWLAAMENPPDREGAVKRWFRTVASHAAGKTRRGAERRRAREEAAARPEATKPTADVVAEAEALRRVVDAVMELEEPYRETVLLRWFQDLAPAAVAARQGVPVETVRTRLRRAVEKLRARLDGEQGGDRRAWVALLAPLTGPAAGGGAGGTAGPSTTTWGAGGGVAATVAAGGILMAKKAAILGTAALLLAAGVGWFALGDGGTGAEGGGGWPGAREVFPVETIGAKAPGTESGGADPVAAVPETGLALEVLVRDSRGVPIPGARVALHPQADTTGMEYQWVSATQPAVPATTLASGTTDTVGRLRLAGLEPGTRVLEAAAPGWAHAWRPVGLLEGAPVDPLVVVLRAACTLTGRVLDAGGRPVPGLAVVASGPGAWRVNSVGRARADTDAEGRYRLEELEPGSNALQVWFPTGQRREVGSILLPGVSTFDIRLEAGATVRGRVLDDGTGEPVAGARLFAWASGEGGAVRATAVTAADGTFVFPEFPPWPLGPLEVRAAGYLPYPHGPGYSVEMVAPRLSAGTVLEQEIRLRRGASLAGRVLDGAGLPVAGVGLTAWVGDQASVPALSAGDGFYRLEGLPPAVVAVSLSAPGRVLAEGGGGGRIEVDLSAGGEAARDFVLEPAPAVEGRVLDADGNPVEGAGVGLLPAWKPTAFTGPGGAYRLAVGPSKNRTVRAFGSGGRRGTSPPFDLERGGSVSGIDIVLEPGVVIAGTLRREDGGRLGEAELRLVDAVPDPSNPWNFESRKGGAEFLVVDAGGGFRAEGLAPGKWSLVAEGRESAQTVLVLGELAAGTRQENLDLVLRAGAFLEGRVSRSDGTPLEGAHLVAPTEAQVATGMLFPRILAVTDAEGRFRCGPLPLESHRVTASATGFRDASAAATPGGESVVLVLESTRAIGGRVVDAETGRPVAGASVAALPSSVEWGFGNAQSATTGEDGIFRIEGATEGTWTVRACLDWTGGDYMETAVRGVAAGTLDLRIEARRGLAIGVRVLGPDGGKPPGSPRVGVRRSQKEGDLPPSWRRGQMTSDGSFRVGGLLPGAYEVQVSDEGGVGHEVFPRTVVSSVPAGTLDLVVTVAPGLRIAGRVVLDGVGPPSGDWNVQVLPTAGGIVLFSTKQPDGSFVSPPLPAGVSHDVIAVGPPGWPHLRVPNVLPGKEDLLITLQRGKTMEGRVVDETGAPVPAGVPVMGTVTREGGEFTVEGLRDRPYRVVAGGPPSVYEPAATEGKHSPGETGIVVTVRRGVTLSGRVVGPEGTGLRGIWTTFMVEETATSPGCWCGVDTDATGNFTVTGLPAGPVKVKALHPRRGDVDLGTVDAPGVGVVLRMPE